MTDGAAAGREGELCCDPVFGRSFSSAQGLLLPFVNNICMN